MDMRHIIDLVEGTGAGDALSVALAPTPAFLAAIRKAIPSDWRQDYRADEVLLPAITAFENNLRVFGNVEPGSITVWRAELRPSRQVEERSFGSVGCYWSWDGDAAEVIWDQNAYDSHGRDGLVKVIFEADVPIASVDWAISVAQNLVHRGEREIRVGRSAPIQRLYIGDEDVEWSAVLPVTHE